MAESLRHSAVLLRDRVVGRRPAHFLHVGKTGGSAIKDALRPVRRSGRYALELHKHPTTLHDVPEGERFFFAVRDPIGRFVSGFYTRQRQGRPRYDVAWSPDEAAAFAEYETPNGLAEQIDRSESAREAMRSIFHVRSSYWDWFGDEDYFRSRLPDLLFVARQDHLSEDFATLCSVLRVNAALPSDDVGAHRNPAGLDLCLSPVAEANLREWYRRDFDFLDLLAAMPAVPRGS